jgi:hypothetical protein
VRQAENSGKRFKRGATASSNMIASDQPGFVVSQPQASDQICSAKTNRFMADVDPPLMKKVFYIAKRERKPNIKHHSQADDLRARFKVPEWGVFCHTARLRDSPVRLKLVLSDSTLTRYI